LHGYLLEPPNPGPYAGVPCGGIGGGSIGRGFRGDFRRWSLRPGKYNHNVVDANQFSLRIKRGDIIESVVLSVIPPTNTSNLKAWNWTLNPNCAVYHAIFPRCWTVYDNPLPGVKVIIKQVSPFIPHNYTESSLPVAAFIVNVENTGNSDIEASIMFTFQNGDGSQLDAQGGFVHSPFTIKSDQISTNSGAVCGVSMHNYNPVYSNVCTEDGKPRINAYDNGSMSIAAMFTDDVEITYCPSFTVQNELLGTDVPNNSVFSFVSSLFSHHKLQTSEEPSSSVSNSSPISEVTSAADLWKSFQESGSAPKQFTSG